MLNIIDRPTHKVCSSPNYNYLFNKKTGAFYEWSTTKEEDPLYAPFPNIADIEISSAVDAKTAAKYSIVNGSIAQTNEDYIVTKGGCDGIGCGFCYKQNGKHNYTLHMSLTGFKKLADKLPEGLCQIAMGATTIQHHPEFWDICKEGTRRGLAMNVTVNGGNLDQPTIEKLAQHCNAIAVSVNSINKDMAYDAIEQLIGRPEKRQINIHYVLSMETFDGCKRTIEDCQRDKRLAGLNALVLLMFKNKSTNALTTITDPLVYKELIDYAEKLQVPLGFDSCSAYNYLKAIQHSDNYDTQSQYVTPCCGGRFSAYFDVFMNYHACSFLEGREEWGEGIPILPSTDFIKDVWNHPRTEKFRQHNIERSKKMRNPCKYFD